MRRSTFLTAAAAVAAVPAAARAKSTGVAFEPRSPVPVVRGRAGGQELRLAIDTGDTLSTLSREAARALDLPLRTPADAKFSRTTLHGMSLGGTVLRDHAALVNDVSSWTSLVGFPVDGSLGYGAFRDLVVTLDYANRRLSFPDVLPDGERAAITWLAYHDGSTPLITFDGLTVEGSPVTAQFDTAMSKNLILFTTKLHDVLIDNAPREPLYTYEDATLVPGHVGSVRLGTTTLMASNVVVYEAGAGAHVPTTAINAVAGDGLFAKRAVTLDFPNATLIVG